MSEIDWKNAEEKLKALMGEESRLDVYVVINILVPLRNRLTNGDRSVRLYNRIMQLKVRSFTAKPPAPDAPLAAA